ncbi:MAG: hypothetical protein R2854_31165 [Caldilineaceae bacterium]
MSAVILLRQGVLLHQVQMVVGAINAARDEIMVAKGEMVAHQQVGRAGFGGQSQRGLPRRLRLFVLIGSFLHLGQPEECVGHADPVLGAAGNIKHALVGENGILLLAEQHMRIAQLLVQTQERLGRQDAVIARGGASACR